MTKQPIKFGPWRPDQIGVNSQFMRNVNNCTPADEGFDAIGKLFPQTDALPDEPNGAAAIIDETGNGFFTAGTKTDLYRLVDGAWVEVTRGSGDYTLQTLDKWRFAGYNQDIFATSFAEPLQQYTIGTSTEYDDAVATEGAIPQAKYIANFGPFLVLGNINTVANGARLVRWSAINDPLGWLDGENQAGFQGFTEGGPVTGLVSGEIGFVLLQDKVWQFTYQPGSPLVFQIDEIENQRGCVAPDSLVHTGRLTFFYSYEGFLELQPGATQNIGSEKINEWFSDNVRPDQVTFIKGAADPLNTRVFWAFVSNNNAGLIPDKIIIYDWQHKEWSKAGIVVKEVVSTIAQGRTLDSLDDLDPILAGKTDSGSWTDATAYTTDEYVVDDSSTYLCISNHTSDSTTKPGYTAQGVDWETVWVDAGNLDALPASLDSPQWTGGSKFISVFDQDNRLSTLTGETLEAVFETNDISFNVEGRAFVGHMVPKANEATNVFGQACVREQLTGSVDLGEENSLEFDGTIPIHKSGKFIRTKLRIPEGAEFTRVSGFDLELEKDGSQ